MSGPTNRRESLARYSRFNMESDTGRLAAWAAELRQAVALNDIEHIEYLARAIATVAGRVADQAPALR